MTRSADIARSSQLLRPARNLDVLVGHLTNPRDEHSRFSKMSAPVLSSREIEILQCSAEGMTAFDIAGHLCLSQETVHSHVKNAVQKLNVTNKTAAVVRALRLGLID